MVEVAVETERLILRTWTDADKAEFVRVTNTLAVMRWLGGVQGAEAMTAAFQRIDGYQRDFGHTLWAVERAADGAILGFCGLKRVNSLGAGPLTDDFEIGWRLREDAWGQGFAKEAAVASLDLAFDRYAAPHVVALTVASNLPSQGLMERLGMSRRQDLDFIDPRFGPELNPSLVWRVEAPNWPSARARALRPQAS